MHLEARVSLNLDSAEQRSAYILGALIGAIRLREEPAVLKIR